MGDEDVSKDKAKQAKQEKKDKKDAEKLLTELQLTEFHKDATVSKDKEFPLTASQFFEATNRWFSSVVSRRAAKLEKKTKHKRIVPIVTLFQIKYLTSLSLIYFEQPRHLICLAEFLSLRLNI